MRQDLRLLCEEASVMRTELFSIIDGLLTPSDKGFVISTSDVKILMKVCALLPKMARMADFLDSIGVKVVPDTSNTCEFFLDPSEMDGNSD